MPLYYMIYYDIRPISVLRFWNLREFGSSVILMLRGGILMYLGNVPVILESTNLSRDNVSREIGRTAMLCCAMICYDMA